MTKKQFNYLIKSPKKHINKLNVDEIQSLKTQFPYCEIIYNISLIKSHFTNDINFTDNLGLTALYSSNRQNLFDLINPAIKIKKPNKLNKRSHLFEEWLKDPLLIPPPKKSEENLKKSIEDNNNLTTETLAKLYVEQGHYQRAIQAYQILCLKYPKKSGSFANQIEEIKNKLN